MQEHAGQTLNEEEKAGMKHCVTRDTYTDYTPEDKAKIGRYTSENGPVRATRHFVVPETTRRRLKS